MAGGRRSWPRPKKREAERKLAFPSRAWWSRCCRCDPPAGSPVDESQLWTNRSPREIAEELAADGFEVGPDTVRTILTNDLNLGLRQAVKDEATCNFPQRDEQFQHIGRLRKTFQAEGCPVLSIDTKKKELLGNFHRPGRAYTNGQCMVTDHDFATHGNGA